MRGPWPVYQKQLSGVKQKSPLTSVLIIKFVLLVFLFLEIYIVLARIFRTRDSLH